MLKNFIHQTMLQQKIVNKVMIINQCMENSFQVSKENDTTEMIFNCAIWVLIQLESNISTREYLLHIYNTPWIYLTQYQD